eukprot:14996675-Alexandrium_andersonii.AAC.1
MSASLVGSEMCIRDRRCHQARLLVRHLLGHGSGCQSTSEGRQARACSSAVSYTHLTLPTICSV